MVLTVKIVNTGTM